MATVNNDALSTQALPTAQWGRPRVLQDSTNLLNRKVSNASKANSVAPTVAAGGGAAGVPENCMDVDAVAKTDQNAQYQQHSSRPRRSIKKPRRYSPVKPGPRRRGVIYMHYTANMHEAACETAADIAAAPADAAAAAAAEADLAAASLGLQLSEQYVQLLLQVQDSLSSIRPSQIYLSPQDFLEELSALASHKQQLQQMEVSMDGIADTILQMIPQELQHMAQQIRRTGSKTRPAADDGAAAGGAVAGSVTSSGGAPTASTASRFDRLSPASFPQQQQLYGSPQYLTPAAAAAAAAAISPPTAAAAGGADSASIAGLLWSQGYGSPTVACPRCFDAAGLFEGVVGPPGLQELAVGCSLCGWCQPLGYL